MVRTDLAAEVYVGVDVSKGHLDVFVRPAAERFSVSNDAAGVDTLLARFEQEASRPTLVVLEATDWGL